MKNVLFFLNQFYYTSWNNKASFIIIFLITTFVCSSKLHIINLNLICNGVDECLFSLTLYSIFAIVTSPYAIASVCKCFGQLRGKIGLLVANYPRTTAFLKSKSIVKPVTTCHVISDIGIGLVATFAGITNARIKLQKNNKLHKNEIFIYVPSFLQFDTVFKFFHRLPILV